MMPKLNRTQERWASYGYYQMGQSVVSEVLEDVDMLYTANTKALNALRELYTMVQGECPGLLNEDSGGNAELALEIESLLNEDII
jgi:hypothetical protein